MAASVAAVWQFETGHLCWLLLTALALFGGPYLCLPRSVCACDCTSVFIQWLVSGLLLAPKGLMIQHKKNSSVQTGVCVGECLC
ncbi:hypothetical protein COO60DRAFT_955812 [Scenedesmus sp. NREL 46B-D3]|nr:hypothetical protein COO60DRAFT_955812 [Scenedesmus sp. NREL 46B-D3]